PDLNYSVAGVGDVNHDQRSDIVWVNNVTGDVVLWLMNGLTPIGGLAGTLSDLNWHLEAVGDFDNDGEADLFFRNISTADTVVWLMNGFAIKQASFVAKISDTNWQVKAPR